MIEPKRNLILVILLVPLGVALIIGFLFDLPRYYQLSANGIETEGIVIAKRSEYHQYIDVEYQVNNRKFKSGGRAGSIDKTFESVAIGDKVPIYYDPLAPDESTLGDPRKSLKDSITITCFSVLMSVAMILIYKRKELFNNNSSNGK